ncbi:MAG: hypothetical protein A2782_01140 [Candidatus Blackburnbacteria bacterium RIFCSPHIGHO2_01_FULL_43_15b]|uniref:Uncharacterized protein n=1 Tax=Candidatus Blackburnbacteria bacterium RIFCSPHIGHO2_01_FULL_43_15b TaxID=1797513 RepID=A0A1G1V206_9BACT|nr:MAG: hypothetical protein A2782_01140 [Candidatus Blackburnbacteria bacterium RIFCSPHIGHO2_01_FULL_43_15b]
MAAPELENRPSLVGESTFPGTEVVQRPDVAEIAQELGQYIQPVPQPQAVTDDKGQPILTPAGAASNNQVTYTAAQIKEAKKESVTSPRHWLAVFYELLLKRFAFLQN